MSKVLVTGGTGFVASWCIAKLLAHGHDVRTTVRRPEQEAPVVAAMAAAGFDPAKLSFAHVDLLKDAGWDEAVAGCDYVLHVASPMSMGNDKDPDALIRPAREGALRVLQASVKAGVKRVVMTSSAAACNPGGKIETFTDETLWTDPALWKADPYRLSKVLSERAAWDFIKAEGGKTELVTIIPAAIFGPALGAAARSSLLVIDRMLTGMPGVPKVGMCITDVRDLADMHVAAMEAPAAAGERFIITGDFIWMRDIGALLQENLGADGAAAPTRQIPDMLVRLTALSNPQLKALVPMLGKMNRYNSAKAQRLLGYRPRAAKDVLLDCARSLIALRAQPAAA